MGPPSPTKGMDDKKMNNNKKNHRNEDQLEDNQIMGQLLKNIINTEKF